MRSVVSKVKYRLAGGGFLKEVALLAGGTAAGQALVLASSTLLSRLYTPADYGAYAVYGAILSTLLVVASLRYELAIPIPEEDGEAENLLRLSVVILGLTTAVLSAVVLFAGPNWVKFLGAGALAHYTWLLPLGVMGAGIYQVFSYWGIRHKAFGVIARTKLTQSLGLIVTQLALGSLAGPLGLLLGDVVGRTLGSVGLAKATFGTRRRGPAGLNARSIRSCWDTAVSYRRFPLINSWSALLNSISLQLPVALLSMLFGPTTAGLFSLCLRVIQAPMSLIGQAVAQVFLSRAGDAQRGGTVSELTWQVFSRLLSLAVGPFLLLSVSGTELFSFVFGANWVEAGLYAQWLAPWLLLVFITSPLSSLVLVMDRQKQELYFQASLLVGRFLALATGAYLGSVRIAIALYGITGLLLWLLYLYWLMNISGISFRRVTRFMGLKMIRVLPLVVPLLICKAIEVPSYVGLLVFAATGCLTLWHIYREFRGLGL